MSVLAAVVIVALASFVGGGYTYGTLGDSESASVEVSATTNFGTNDAGNTDASSDTGPTEVTEPTESTTSTESTATTTPSATGNTTTESDGSNTQPSLVVGSISDDSLQSDASKQASTVQVATGGLQ